MASSKQVGYFRFELNTSELELGAFSLWLWIVQVQRSYLLLDHGSLFQDPQGA